MKLSATVLLLALAASACGGSTATTSSSSVPPSVVSPPTTAVSPSTTTAPPTSTAAVATTTSAVPSEAPPGDDFQVWDAAEGGFTVAIPAGWIVVGEIDRGTKQQVVGIMGLPASNELLATPMRLAANPAGNGEGLFVAPIPPGADLGTLDEFSELSELDEAALRSLEERMAGSPGVADVSARLAETSQGDLALVVSTAQFGLRFELITITPQTGVAWTLVASLEDVPASARTAQALFESFRIIGEPTFPEPGPDPEELVAEVAGSPMMEGSSLVPFDPSTSPDPAVGSVAPTVEGSDFDGKSVTIDHDGVPTAVVFVAHWCPYCREEVSMLQPWLGETGGVEDVEIVSVVTAFAPDRGNWPPGDWLEREGWTVPVIRDDAASSVYRAYGAGPLPYWVFVNGDGSVAARSAGVIAVADLEMLLSSLGG